jgi:glycosyltransferase involved in cell wall biosynthesis
MFEVAAVEGLAAAAARIINDPSEGERLGRRGREIAAARFSTEKIIPQYEELYRKVISGEHARRK